jgi:hypothetical protein
MITGDNPLTAVHVARDVEIVDREALILDLRENPAHEGDLTWRTVDESKVIPVDPSEPLDESLFEEYDICITGSAMKQYAGRPGWTALVQNTWVYARVSPAQKEYILTSLKELGYTTLMAGDGTNDVGALKQAHIGVALLDGTPEDLQKIAERQRLERIKKVYESQLSISARFNQAPPPVPAAIAHLIPDVVAAQQRAAADLATARKRNPMERVRADRPFILAVFLTFLSSLTSSLSPAKWRTLTTRKRYPKSSSAMLPVRHRSHPSCRTSRLVSHVSCFRLCLSDASRRSYTYHPAGSMHPRRYYSDVQDPRAQLSDYGVLAQCAVPGWN